MKHEHLSKIIPKHFTVIDLGCAYNPQCFYFTEHKLYVAVDKCKCLKFKSKNCIIYNEGIVEFIKEDLYRYNLHNVFAICSYVLPGNDEVNKLVRDTFSNLFIHYPYPESNPLNDYHDRIYKYWN